MTMSVSIAANVEDEYVVINIKPEDQEALPHGFSGVLHGHLEGRV